MLSEAEYEKLKKDSFIKKYSNYDLNKKDYNKRLNDSSNEEKLQAYLEFTEGGIKQKAIIDKPRYIIGRLRGKVDLRFP